MDGFWLWQGIAIANNVFATADPLLKNACDYISMAESGKYYAFSAISEFQSIANGEIIIIIISLEESSTL
eukprot:COSAG06_NODE_7777_length_2378_cov_12.995963_2_plen_69_part_01